MKAKQFEVGVFKIGTLERVATHPIEADSVEEARKIGRTRYEKTGFFVAAGVKAAKP